MTKATVHYERPKTSASTATPVPGSYRIEVTGVPEHARGYLVTPSGREIGFTFEYGDDGRCLPTRLSSGTMRVPRLEGETPRQHARRARQIATEIECELASRLAARLAYLAEQESSIALEIDCAREIGAVVEEEE